MRAKSENISRTTPQNWGGKAQDKKANEFEYDGCDDQL